MGTQFVLSQCLLTRRRVWLRGYWQTPHRRYRWRMSWSGGRRSTIMLVVLVSRKLAGIHTIIWFRVGRCCSLVRTIFTLLKRGPTRFPKRLGWLGEELETTHVLLGLVPWNLQITQWSHHIYNNAIRLETWGSRHYRAIILRRLRVSCHMNPFAQLITRWSFPIKGNTIFWTTKC